MTGALPVSPTNSASPPPPSSNSSSSTTITTSLLPSPPPLTPKDVALALQQEICNLQAEDEMIIMRAAASLVMFATLPEAEPHLGTSVPHLLLLLSGDYSLHVQRNACAALTAVMNASEMLYHSVAETPNLLKGLLRCLEPRVDDVGLRINALAALSALAQQELGLALIQDAGVEDTLLFLLTDTIDAKLEEDLVDTFCAIAAYERMRPALVHKGAVSKLARHLASDSSEISLRVLLALGMLCGSSMEGQHELAQADGAVKALLKLMTSNDRDVKSIAQDLFSTLTSNQETRLVVQQTMRHSHN
ncbi:hypothetical protein L7F22_042477 [Adiantum nelumboides]|nr:hypothetical protein [Adiantum nelumboides]